MFLDLAGWPDLVSIGDGTWEIYWGKITAVIISLRKQYAHQPLTGIPASFVGVSTRATSGNHDTGAALFASAQNSTVFPNMLQELLLCISNSLHSFLSNRLRMQLLNLSHPYSNRKEMA